MSIWAGVSACLTVGWEFHDLGLFGSHRQDHNRLSRSFPVFPPNESADQVLGCGHIQFPTNDYPRNLISRRVINDGCRTGPSLDERYRTAELGRLRDEG